KEKTGSFHVSLERGSWHCFGCGIGGDGFSFIEKIEGVDFKGALKILADKAGVTIEYSRNENKEEQSKKDKLRTIMSKASEWYASKLTGSPADEYAKKRGLTENTIKTWRLGYAPDEWRALLEFLTHEGFTIQELLSAGLIKEADGKRGTYYDRFRNRLMFPIRDIAGRVVAFTGRALSSGDLAKYLNSPETDLYHKSEILFGMDVAKDAIRVRKFSILVEGQIDVILAHQAGFQNAIALSGTALSEKHLSLMRRYSENLMLVLDADSAGLGATAKSAALALRQGLRVKAVRLPHGKDPADLINEDANDFSKRVVGAKPIVEFFLSELAERERDQHRLMRLAEAIVLPLIASMPSPMEREHFIQSTARSLSLSGEAVRESLMRIKRFEVRGSRFENVNSVRVEEARTSHPAPRTSPAEKRAEQLLAVVHGYPDTDLAKRVKSEYCRITEADRLPSEESSEPALFIAEQMFGEDPHEDAADDLLRAFEEAVIREAYQRAVNNLRRAEADGDAVAISGAQASCSKLSERLSALHKAIK
ncbi:MAG: DNA primase, partial [bacterium]|nr:DNA primase [bacterium]